MPKYDIPQIVIAILEEKVKAVIGEDAIKLVREPVAEAELQARLREAAQRAEQNWLTTYPDRAACSAVQQMGLADLPSVQAAIRRMYDDPSSPITAQTFQAQFANVLPVGLESERLGAAVTAYLEKLQDALVTVDGLREKLTVLAELATARNTAKTAEHSEQSHKELQRLNGLVEQLLKYFFRRDQGVTQAEDLGPLEVHYRRVLVDTFKDLDFKGLTTSARPLLLPLEKVYVQLRAVAEVPEAADEFTPEERRVLRACYAL